MSRDRFIVLDSLRGIAALGVVVFHFRSTVGLEGTRLVDSLYLFVDLFFVLSGFVMGASYADRLQKGFSVWRFMWLRVGRVYPLHLAVLLAWIAMQIVFTYSRTGVWFPAPEESPDTIIANLLLVHSLNVFPFLTWNSPSWSISVEVYTYLLFAFACVVLGRHLWLVCAAVAASAPVFLAVFNPGEYINATSMFGFVRCLFGFSVGILTYKLYASRPHKVSLLRRDQLSASMREAFAILVLVWFLYSIGSDTSTWTLAAPFVFAGVLVVFAGEGGAISSALVAKPFVWLGMLSYSIYMVHMFVLNWWLTVMQALLYKVGGADLFVSVQAFASKSLMMPGINWSGLAMMLTLVIIASQITYTLIEKPTRSWSRRIVAASSTREHAAF